MFDISFAELLVMAVVALIVIGPEKLPAVARTVGKYVGKLQRYIAQVKEEVGREVRFEELQKLQQEIKQGTEKVASSIRTGAQSMAAANATKSTAKKSPVKKQVAKNPVTKKTTVKKVSAKKTSVKNPTVKKSIAKKAGQKQSSRKV